MYTGTEGKHMDISLQIPYGLKKWERINEQ